MAATQLDNLFKAVFEDNADEVRRLIESGTSISANPQHGNTVLRMACQANALRAMRLLLEHGIDPNERITYRSPVDGRVEENYTSLMYASSAAMVDLLVSFGADVNAVSATGLSALMRFAHFGIDDLVEAVLKHGTDMTLRQNVRDGKKALTALEIGQEKLAFMEPLLKDSPKPEAKIALERYRRTLALLSGATQTQLRAKKSTDGSN